MKSQMQELAEAFLIFDKYSATIDNCWSENGSNNCITVRTIVPLHEMDEIIITKMYGWNLLLANGKVYWEKWI